MVISRPDGSDRGRLSVDMMTAFARAQQQHRRACLLPPRVQGHEALFALTSDDVTVVRPSGAARVQCLLRWWMTAAAHSVGERVAAGAASFWQQLYIELRHHAGDERLPSTLRGGLRRMAHDAFSRSAHATSVPHFPRRLLREQVTTRLPRERQTEAELIAATFGVPVGSRIVALEARTPLDPFGDAIDFLVASGCTVARIGSPVAGAIRRPGVVDLAGVGIPLLDVFVMLECDFLVCESTDMQLAAYLTNTPCLLLNAIDPIASYPVRADGLYTLRTPVHLDTGQHLAPSAMLEETYVRERRNLGFRQTPANEILAAVREMHEGGRGDRVETAAQSRFRMAVTDAAARLGRRVYAGLDWGADEGFVGDGRLANVQAERAQ